MGSAAQVIHAKAAATTLRALCHVAEPAMRAAALCDALEQLDDDEAVQLLEALVVGAARKQEACTAVYAGLVDPTPLAVRLGAARLSRLREIAMAQGRIGATHLLLCADLASSERRAPSAERLVHRDLRKLTLGERRALARRASGDHLKKLLVDPDPQVVHNLLANPRCTEAVAVSLAAHRPTVSAALEAVLTSRFAARYRVRLALAKNPHLTEPFALGLLVGLDAPDLTAVRDDGLLSGSRRLAAQRLLDLTRP